MWNDHRSEGSISTGTILLGRWYMAQFNSSFTHSDVSDLGEMTDDNDECTPKEQAEFELFVANIGKLNSPEDEEFLAYTNGVFFDLEYDPTDDGFDLDQCRSAKRG